MSKSANPSNSKSNNRSKSSSGSKTETIIKLILVFVISLLSFSVGTFVGKQFSDSQYRMASLENEYSSEPTRSTASTSNSSENMNNEKHDNQALTDADIASLTEEFVNAEKEEINEQVNQPASQNTVEKSPEQQWPNQTNNQANNQTSDQPGTQTNKIEEFEEQPKMTTDTVSTVAQRVASGNTPTMENKVKEKRQPSSLPKTVASSTIGKYTVQVASYAKQDDAKKHAEKLIKSGFSAFFLEAKINGNSWYRVNVGLFGKKTTALDYKKTLIKEGKLASALVQKIVK